MKQRPMIGVLPLVDYDHESLWMRPGYLDGLEEAGGVPVILPLTYDIDMLAEFAEQLDGVLFTGGHDVDPRCYGQENLSPELANTLQVSHERDEMEIPLLQQMVKVNKPVLGICRGCQLINVALGGTLWLDLPTQHPSEVNHCTKEHNERFKHQVSVTPQSPLGELLDRMAAERDIQRSARMDCAEVGESCAPSANATQRSRHRESELAKTSQLHGAYQYLYTSQLDDHPQRNANGAWVIGVNSYHHQAVREIAPSLEVMAVSEDGIVEGVWRPASRFVWGIQWHPELLHRVDARSRAIFSAFVDAARES